MSACYRPPALRQTFSTAPPPLEIMDEHVSNDLAPTTVPEIIEPVASVSKRLSKKLLLSKKLFSSRHRRVERTSQLVFLIKAIPNLLPSAPSRVESQVEEWPPYSADRLWFEKARDSPFEQDRIRSLIRKMVEQCVQETDYDNDSIAEIVHLSSALDGDSFQRVLSHLLTQFKSDQGDSLLEGILQLIQEAPIEFLEAEDLEMILKRVLDRIQRVDRQPAPDPAPFEVMSAVGQIVDVMLRFEAYSPKERIINSKPTVKLLLSLEKRKADPYVVYHVSYAFQALMRSPGNETVILNLVRRAKEVTQAGAKNVGTRGGNYHGLLDTDMKVHYVGATFTEKGNMLFKALRKGSLIDQKRGWYEYLRAAKILAQEGEIDALKDLVAEAPCRKDHEFQWGISQLLGEIALDKEWEPLIREHAVNILLDLEEDSEWTHDSSVKSWILYIHHMLRVGAPDFLPSSVPVITLTEDPAGSAPSISQLYPLKARLSCQRSFPLMVKVYEIPGVEDKLEERKKSVTHREQSIYVPPVAKASLQTSDDNGFLLMKKVNNFLQGEQEVFLLIGEAGAGKTTFFQHLEQQLWTDYTAGGPIPLLIDLPTIQNPETNLIHEHLSTTFGFSNETIQALKDSRNFILICDGYDERQLGTNLYTSNQLKLTGQWSARLILSCQTSYLGEDYERWFEPQPGTLDSTLFRQAVLVPFGKDQIGEVVQQYVSQGKRRKHLAESTVWSVEMYQTLLFKIQNLAKLVKIPFHLFMALEALPTIVDETGNFSKTKVSLLALYRAYMDQYFEDINERIESGRIDLSPQEKSIYETMQESTGFKAAALDYLKELASVIYLKKAQKPTSQPSSPKVDTLRAQVFFKLCPLRKVQNTHQFKHRSLLEYFYACYIFEGMSQKNSETEQLRRLGGYPLVQNGVLKEFSIVFLLAERVLEDIAGFQKTLHQCYKRTSNKKFRDSNATQAAVNAITILVRAGVSFNGADLKSIKIPGADLSCGLFDCADFQRADLNGVSFNKTWLRNADFTDARMSQVQFGERISLKLGKTFRSCAYSRDGQFLALGADKGEVDIFEISSRNHYCYIRDFGAPVTTLAFSRTGLIALGGAKSQVRISYFLKDAERRPNVILDGHLGHVSCVAFSSDGFRIASASYDKTVRIWDATSGKCLRTLRGHGDEVLCVAWSPDGSQVVSGSMSGYLFLWDVDTGSHSCLFNGNGYKLTKVLFAPNGQHIAVAYGYDLLLQSLVLRPPLALKGHSSDITAMAFSPDGQWLVSSSRDQSARLWCAKTGREVTKFCGHSHGIYDTVFIGDQEISTCGRDRTARFWDLSRELAAARMGSHGPHAEERGHTSLVSMVAYSPTGEHFFSSSWDKTVRKWTVATGESEVLNFVPSGRIEGVAYSPDGKHVAVADQSEKITIRILPGSDTTGEQVPSILPVSGYCMAYSPCGRWLVSGNKNGYVRLWDLKERRELNVPDGHKAAVSCIAFSPLGHQFATGSDDRKVRLWDITDGTPCTEIVGRHMGDITDLAFSPCGQMVVTSSGDRTVRVWDLVHKTETQVLESPRCWIRSVAWSPCGQWIACGFDRKTVQIWGRRPSGNNIDGQTEWSCRATLDLFLGYVRCVAWNPKPGVLEFVTGGTDHTVYAWTIELDNPDIQKATLSIKLKWWSDTRLVTVGAKFTGAQGLDDEQRQVLLQGSDEYAFEAALPEDELSDPPSSPSLSPYLQSPFRNGRSPPGSNGRGIRGKTRLAGAKTNRYFQPHTRSSGEWRVGGQAGQSATSEGGSGGLDGDNIFNRPHPSRTTRDGGCISEDDRDNFGERPTDDYEE